MENSQLRPCPNCGSIARKPRFREDPFLVVECLGCSLVYLGNPPPEDHLYDDYYGSEGPDPDLYCAGSSDPALRELYAINTQRVGRIQRLRSTGRVLDIGCGRGSFVKTASDHGFEAQGVDVSERAVAYAREHFGVDAEVGSFEDLQATGETFDIVTMWHVLEHVVNPVDVLTQIRSLLRPDGLCVVEVPNLRSLKFMLSKTKWEGGNHPLYHRSFFTESTLRDTMKRSGYSKSRRMRWSYRVPGRSGVYESAKRVLDTVGLDAFLDVVAWR